jgi:hypothetical protein
MNSRVNELRGAQMGTDIDYERFLCIRGLYRRGYVAG